MISKNDIEVGDKVLVNWDEYVEYYSRFGDTSFSFAIKQAIKSDSEFTVVNFDGDNVLCGFDGGYATWIHLRLLHKIY